ncbi:MAG: hypothetical protein COW03_17035 [Cytophagales bacterium CG12_big_fil_rev_8_21_14_0_65_40_12]|nr:MAG: hypothetical protein COW03_17035 [Cytophagales bacterium CG12_big_fil_rev_8_21_14_0_65_40_12]PIW05690.1 MAG: hypothetical protein COW40_03385 [Cytophagales bacterium CG17_big_fil_post_rev_8_21_14_2_50_40_13]
MSFFDDVFKKLFPERAVVGQELIHEPLERTTQELESYNAWINSEEAGHLMSEVYNSYQLKKKGITAQLDVHLLESPYSNGFAISFNQEKTKEEFRNLFDFFKEKALDFNYKLAQKDRRIIDRETYEEVIEKWYLKPQAEPLEKNKFNQLYGNILIEYVLIDRKPSYIKLMANIYQDRMYSKALNFDELIEKLFI